MNTLDMLKKGTSILAQRARTASRLLEAQVGSNPRIRVQRDDAFVPWDDIRFADNGIPINSSPEWVRRTICCARWEVEAPESLKQRKRVVLAVVKDTSDSPESSNSDAVSASPVPLPAPLVGRHEPRSSGLLVAQWASRAGVEVFELPATPASVPNNTAADPQPAVVGRRSGEYGRRSNDLGRRSPDEDRNRRTQTSPRGRRNSHMRNAERTSPQPPVSLVERPPAVMAMMEMVSQPTRVVRVLARGEKLEPDP